MDLPNIPTPTGVQVATAKRSPKHTDVTVGATTTCCRVQTGDITRSTRLFLSLSKRVNATCAAPFFLRDHPKKKNFLKATKQIVPTPGSGSSVPRLPDVSIYRAALTDPSADDVAQAGLEARQRSRSELVLLLERNADERSSE